MHEPDPTGARQDLTVGEAARLVGVSVRTLHHWDALGLAVPSGRTWSGYRLYSPDDVARLQQVLVYRETGMPLMSRAWRTLPTTSCPCDASSTK